MNEDVLIENLLVSAISHIENWAHLNRKLLFKPPDGSRSWAVIGAVSGWDTVLGPCGLLGSYCW